MSAANLYKKGLRYSKRFLYWQRIYIFAE